MTEQPTRVVSLSHADEIWTARDVAEYLGLTPGTIVDWFEAGKLPGFKLGGTKQGRLRFRKSEILATLETWRAGAPAPDAAVAQMRVA